jgi:hypothetical protein
MKKPMITGISNYGDVIKLHFKRGIKEFLIKIGVNFFGYHKEQFLKNSDPVHEKVNLDKMPLEFINSKKDLLIIAYAQLKHLYIKSKDLATIKQSYNNAL